MRYLLNTLMILMTLAEFAVAVPKATTSNNPRYRDTTRYSLKSTAINELSQPTSLERVRLYFSENDGLPKLSSFPSFDSVLGGKYASTSQNDDLVVFSLDRELQDYVEDLVRKTSVPHVSIVAMDPMSGKILAIFSKSTNRQVNLSTHSGFRAASLFKLVTSAAALEYAKLSPEQGVHFRGGTYTLNKYNYLPNPRLDRRFMSITEALGRSCNAVFARIALKFIPPNVLQHYTNLFGFNFSLNTDFPIEMSHATIPDSQYSLSRTAAGFGEVSITPIHAAAIMAGIANGGFLPKPHIIDRVISRDGNQLYEADYVANKRFLEQDTTEKLLDMMVATTTIGTSKREFYIGKSPRLPGVKVAAKTGTLRGDDPKGINNWFIAAAPKENPKIVLSVVVVHPTSVTTRASRLGRMVLEKYFL